MVRDLARRLAVASIALALSVFAAGAASAQDTPPAFSAVDANGVDLSSGNLVLSETPISVGSGAGALAHPFLEKPNKPNGRDALSGTLLIEYPDVETGVSVYTYTVSFGSTSSVFTRANLDPSTPFVQADNANNSFLSINGDGKYVFLGADGTTATFSLLSPYDSEAKVETILAPSGEKLIYTYTSYTCGLVTCYHLQAVTSNLGYMIKYQYAASANTLDGMALASVKAINLGYDSCNPAATSCATSYAWMSTTLASANWATASYTATDSLQYVTTYSVIGGLIHQIARPGGLTYTIDYDSQDRVHTVSAPGATAGSVRTWTYDYVVAANGALTTTVTDPETHQRTAKFSGVGGYMTSSSDQEGRSVVYENDPTTGRVTKVTNQPLGDSYAYEYDARGNVITITHKGTGVADAVTHFNYPSTCDYTNLRICNKPTYVIDPRNNRTDYVYDSGHGGAIRVTGPAVTDANGVVGARPQTRLYYKALQAWYKDPTGALVPSEYIWRLSSTSSCIIGAGLSALASDSGPLDAAMTTDCGGTANEVKTTYVYGRTNTLGDSGNVRNNLLPTSVTVSDGTGTGATAAVTTYGYDRFGNVTSVDGPNNGNYDSTYYRYDNARQLTDVIYPDPDGQSTGRPASATHYAYLADGRLDTEEAGTAASNAAAVSVSETRKIEYDNGGRPQTETLKVSSTPYAVQQYVYDNADRLTCSVLRMNLTVLTSNICSASTASADGPDRITKYEYDTADRIKSTTTAFGVANEERTESVAYVSGQQRTITDGKGNVTTYLLDGFGRVQTVKFPAPDASSVGTSSNSDLVTYGYDAASNVTSIQRRDSTTDTIGYDELGRMKSRSAPATKIFYDNRGLLTSISKGGLTFSRAYDVRGRMTSETGPLGTVSYLYAYTNSNPRRRITWPDNKLVDYVYDYAGALTEVRESAVASGLQLLAKIDYDQSNRRLTLTEGNGVVKTYGYDPVSRLNALSLTPAGGTDVQNLGFDYNNASQIRTRTGSNSQFGWNGFASYAGNRDYTVNGLNQLTKVNDKFVSYNSQGNLQSVCANQNETQCDNVYGYDADGNLASSTLTTNGGASTSNASMVYDPFGRLYSVTDSNNTVTRFQYDGSDLIGEYSGSGAMLRRYVHGQGADEPLVWYEGSTFNDRRWFSSDERGSVVAVTDDTGAVKLNSGGSKMILTYDDYGVPGATNGGVRFQYTGQVWMPELALYHYKARAYSPYHGRFLQTDPIGYADGLNWYAYVGDDPVNRIDPTGMNNEGCGNPGFPACPASGQNPGGAVDEIVITGSILGGRGGTRGGGVNINGSDAAFIDPGVESGALLQRRLTKACPVFEINFMAGGAAQAEVGIAEVKGDAGSIKASINLLDSDPSWKVSATQGIGGGITGFGDLFSKNWFLDGEVPIPTKGAALYPLKVREEDFLGMSWGAQFVTGFEIKVGNYLKPAGSSC